MNLTTIAPANATSTHCIHGSLTGPLGLLVQALLAAIAFSALIVKRYCEPIKTRRPWKTWWLDTSKQAVGAGVIHMANVFLSEALFSGDPCTWYIISFMLDSTLGLMFICVCLKICLWVIVKYNYRMLLFGNYDSPMACTSWFYQCLVYVGVIALEKCAITLLTLLPLWSRLSSWMLSTTSNATLELFIVMFLVPLVVNAIIFWVVDNYLKLHHASPPTNRHYHLFSEDGDDEDEDGGVSNSIGNNNISINGGYKDDQGRANCYVMYERREEDEEDDGGHDDDDDDAKTNESRLL